MTTQSQTKTIIITGANGGLGTSVVKKFLDSGYYVIGVDAKNNHLGFVAEDAKFEFHSVNLSNENETNDFINAAIAKHNKIHAAIMLVGGFAMGNIEKTAGEDIHKMFSLNFETAYYIARPLLQHMKANGYGRLVFTGARPALKPAQGKGVVAYALTKSLLFRLAEFINEEAKSTDVVASVIVPSTIDTAANRKDMPGADFTAWVKPEEIANVLEFICSENGSPLREPVYKVYNNA